MIHPYNYNPWVYKFSRDAMGPHSQHIDDDPEDSRPKSAEEKAGTPEAMAKKDAADAEEKKLKDAAQEMKDGAEKEPSKADEAKKDAEALEGAMKKADLAEAVAKVEKKEEKKEEKKADFLCSEKASQTDSTTSKTVSGCTILLLSKLPQKRRKPKLNQCKRMPLPQLKKNTEMPRKFKTSCQKDIN